jgi:hypothetical protein
MTRRRPDADEWPGWPGPCIRLTARPGVFVIAMPAEDDPPGLRAYLEHADPDAPHTEPYAPGDTEHLSRERYEEVRRGTDSPPA